MFQTGKRLNTLSLFLPSLACAILLFSLTTSAQERRALNGNSAAPVAAAADDEPPFKEYKGVRLGMSADEVRKKLGSPQDKSEQQDFYSFSDKEGAQVFYDAERKVS